MQISEQGIDAIKRREGFRAHAYPDANGYSCGYGHFGVAEGYVCTLAEAEDWLEADLARAEAAVNSGVSVEITQFQFDALISFTYNVGAHAFLSSTLLERINTENLGDVPNQFMRWVFSGGVESPALEARRRDEISQFQGDMA